MLHVSIPPGPVLHRHSSQCVTDQSFCELPLLIIALCAGILCSRETLPTIFASRAAILHAHEPLLVTFVSHISLLHGSEPLPMTIESPFILLLVFEPPRVTSELHVVSLRVLFLHLVLSVHWAETNFAEKHQTLAGG
jgi:hypothetical protein